MEIIFENNCTRILGANNFSPTQTFDCGQCFRFDKDAHGAYCGVAKGKYIRVSENGGGILIENCGKEDFENIFHSFFHLDFDYDKAMAKLPDDDILAEAKLFSGGIRILRQDPWEALCSFIISQNNNIPRIKGIIKNLCTSYGEKIYTDKAGQDHYSFPDAQTVKAAGIEGMTSLRTGFRAKYIIDAAEKVSSGEIDIDAPYKMSYADGTDYLSKIKGVGSKVASCVLLFGYGKYDAFPVDVWVKRILEKYYNNSVDPSYFGEYAGIAQQYLFYFERCKRNVFIK